MNTLFRLPGDVFITLDDQGNGNIESGLREYFGDPEDSEWLTERIDAICDALESLALAQACAGMNLLDKPYYESWLTTLEAIGQQLDNLWDPTEA